MKKISLLGTWTLSKLEDSESGAKIPSIAMTIPGDNYSALVQAGLMKDPYYAFNEQDALWAGRCGWLIRRTFQWKKTGKAGSCCLCLDRADTFFTIRINGAEVGKGDNYFRLWRFDVASYLRDGENEIEIAFASAEKEAAKIAQGLPYPIPFTQYDVLSPHRNLVRRIQCAAGWDWGPCLMTSGIYGDIFIEEVQDVSIRSVSVETRPLKEGEWGGVWTLTAQVRCHCGQAGEKDFSIDLAGNGANIHLDRRETLAAGEGSFMFNLEVPSPVLWKSADELNPLGVPLGSEPQRNRLYRFSVTSSDGASMTQHIGFRTLVLRAVKESGGQPGLGIFFELNGRPLFAKGANFVPVDALPSRWTEGRYRYLLESAVRANMNSLRFWGGGQYESDLCYRLCDELGLVIWQDCMFACSLYPANESFLASVEKEIEDNVYRLQHHPSLAVWCGNNENLGALTWYEESRKNRDLYLLDFDRLNHGTVEKTVRRCDPGRSWWPSSPCAGTGENAFADNWTDDSQGDMHFWSVWHGKEDMEKYMSIKPRFVSEFGYESFPSMEGLLEFTEREHTNLTDPVMEYHQRSPSGNSIILENFSRYFRFPTGSAAATVTEATLYLSQVQQALALKTAVQYWRSLRPHCMGALYWQLGDVWPVTSWSSIEYSGKWKLAHYAAQKFFSPLAFFLFKKDGKVFAFVVNETSRPAEAELTIELSDFDGRKLFSWDCGSVGLAGDEAKCVWSMGIEKLAEKLPAGLGTADCFLYGMMAAKAAAAPAEGGGRVCMDDTLFLERWKRCPLKKAAIQAQALPSGQIRLTSDKPAFYVSLNLPGIQGQFSDNMLTLLPGREKTLDFRRSGYGWHAVSGEESGFTKTLEKKITILSLKDSYCEG